MKAHIVELHTDKHLNAFANKGISPGDEYTHAVVCDGPIDEYEALKRGVFRAIRNAAREAGLKSSTYDIYRHDGQWVMADCWKA